MNIDKIIKKHLRNVLSENTEDGTYMVLQNLVQMRNDIDAILKCKHHPDFGKLVTGEHAWAGDHITTSKDDIEEVSNFITSRCQSEEMNESEKEMYEAMVVDESKNCPTDPGKWAASKAAAKAKFDVYPSAYANGWAAKNYKSKGGGWRKCK